MRHLISWFAFSLVTFGSLQAQTSSQSADLQAIQVQMEVGQTSLLEAWRPESGRQLTDALSLEIKGMQFESRFDLRHAVDMYLKSLSAWSLPNESQPFQRVSGRLGHVLSELQEWSLADEYFERAMVIQDPVWTPWVLYWSAQHMQKKGVMGASLDAYQKAIDGFQASGQLLPAQRISFSLGNAQARLGNWEQAEAYYQISGDLARQLGQDLEMARVAQALAWLYVQAGEKELAHEVAQAGLGNVNHEDPVLQARLRLVVQFTDPGAALTDDFFLENEAVLQQSTAYLNGYEQYYLEKSEILEQMGEANRALTARKRYDMFRDSAQILTQSSQAAQLVTRFESELQAREQEAQIVQLESERSYHRMILFLLIGLSLALIGMFGALYLRYNQKRKDHEKLVQKNRQIEIQRDEISRKNEELEHLNERLISEIADREYLEHTQEQNAHYLAALSQELRNPLQAIQGVTGELLTHAEMTAHHGELLKIRSSSQDIVQYLNDLLDKARLESGKIIFAVDPFDPVRTIEDTLERFRELAERRDISLRIHADGSVDRLLIGDPIRMTQILSNLMRMVFQQQDLKAITISLKMRDGDAPDRRILDIDIGSDGRVENPDLLREVLTAPLSKGFQKPGSYYNGHTGLFLSRRLVELQDGLLLLETQANATHLRIWLPYLLAEQSSMGDQIHKDSTLLQGKSILLAEDNRMNQWVVSKVLEEKGAEVTCCDDGVQAMEAFRQKDFDLVIMDLQMPEMDGYRTTQAIRKLASQKGRSVPILAMTASAYVVSPDKAALFSMDDYLGKPFDRSALLSKAIGLISRTVKV